MKKIITTLFLVSMFIFVTAEASENSLTISVLDEVINITGRGNIAENELITFVCVDSSEEADMLNDDNLPYFIEAFNANDDEMDVNVKIPDSMSGGKYYIIATGENFFAEGYFVYIDKSKLDKILEKINSAKSYSQIEDIILEEDIDIDFEIYNMNKDVMNKIIFAGIGEGYDADTFIKTLNKGYFAILVSEGKSEDAFIYYKDEEIFKQYRDLENTLDFEKAFAESDFDKDSVESAAMKALMTSKAKTAKTWRDLRDEILLSSDTTPSEKSREYFDFDIYNKIKNKNTVFQKMMEKIDKVENFTELKALFEKTAKDVYDEENKPSKGTSGGGGGSSSGGGSYGGMYSPVIPDNVEEEKPDEIIFSDVNNHWAKDEIYKLKNAGIIKGYEDNTFKPDNFVTRAEMVKMICVAFSLSGKGEMNFSDVLDKDWYYEYINIAYSNGIVNGKGDVFSPQENITREDATVIMYRLLSKNHPIASGNASFIDKADISVYAKEAIGGMKNEGIIEGVGKNRFEPKSPITRAQCAVLINRCMLRFEITE